MRHHAPEDVQRRPDAPDDDWIGVCSRCGKNVRKYDGIWRHYRPRNL